MVAILPQSAGYINGCLILTVLFFPSRIFRKIGKKKINNKDFCVSLNFKLYLDPIFNRHRLILTPWVLRMRTSDSFVFFRKPD